MLIQQRVYSYPTTNGKYFYVIKRKEYPYGMEDTHLTIDDFKGPNEAPDIRCDMGGATLVIARKFASKGIKGIKTPNS